MNLKRVFERPSPCLLEVWMGGVRKGRRVNPLMGINPLSAGSDSLDQPGESVQAASSSGEKQ